MLGTQTYITLSLNKSADLPNFSTKIDFADCKKLKKCVLEAKTDENKGDILQFTRHNKWPKTPRTFIHLLNGTKSFFYGISKNFIHKQ